MTARRQTSEQTAGAVFDDPRELQQEIEHTRQELGDTGEALAHRLDVRARAQDKAADVRQRARDGARQAAAVSGRRVPLAVAAGVALVVACASWWWRRRRRRG